MNKRRLEEAVLRNGWLMDEEAAARTVNAEPWQPPNVHRFTLFMCGARENRGMIRPLG